MVALQTDAARARAAVEAAVNARGRLIDELDQRRDLAAQFVVELQQAQLQLERTIASADTSSTVASLPIRPFRGDSGLAGGRKDRVAIRPLVLRPFRHVDRPKWYRTATTQGATALAVHEGTVAFAGPFAGSGMLAIVDHGNQPSRYMATIEATVSAGPMSAAARRSEGSACARQGEPPCTSSCASTGPVDPAKNGERGRLANVASRSPRGAREGSAVRWLGQPVSIEEIITTRFVGGFSFQRSRCRSSSAVVGGFMSKADRARSSYHDLRTLEDGRR